MFEASPEIYNNVGRFPSFQDMEAQRNELATNRLHQLILQHAINQQPVADQLQQLQLATGQISNQEAQTFNRILQLVANKQANRMGGQSPGGAPASPGGMPGMPANTGGGFPSQQGPVDPTPGTPGSTPPQQMPASVNSAPSTPSADDPSGLGLSFQDIGALKLGSRGKIDMLPEFRLGLEGANHPSGGFVTDIHGNTKYNPKVPDGMVIDPATGVTSNAPGYVGAAAEIARANERAKNSEALLPPTYTALGANGAPPRPVGGSVDAFLHPGAPAGAPGAPAAAPMPIDQLSPAGQQAAMADMVARGQDPSTMKVNGAPAFGGMQEQLDAAKKGGPATMTQFFNTVAPHLDAKQKAGLMYDLHTPPGTPIHALGGATAAPAVAAPAAGAAPVLAGPADVAGATLAAEQAVHAKTDAPLQLGKDLVVKSHDANQAFLTDLGKTVNEESEIVARNERLQPYLNQLQNAGGFGYDQRVTLANNIKNSGILPKGASDALANWIAGGDPVAAKTISNQLATAAIQTMEDTLSKGRPNKPIFTALEAEKESLAKGLPVVGNVMGLQKQLRDQHLSQLDEASNMMADPKYNPIRFQAQFQSAKSVSTQAGSGAPGAPPAASTPAAITQAEIAAILRKHGIK